MVAALHAGLKKMGVTGRKDQARDLSLVEDGLSTVLFEVETSTDTQSIYTAAGQLYWHSGAATWKIAVLPRPLLPSAREQLTRQMIECIEYDWNDRKPEIFGLATLLG